LGPWSPRCHVVGQVRKSYDVDAPGSGCSREPARRSAIGVTGESEVRHVTPNWFETPVRMT